MAKRPAKTAAKTPIQVARDRIKSSYSPDWYRGLQHQIMLGFGSSYEHAELLASQTGLDDYGDGILRFTDVSTTIKRKGEVDLIRATSMISMARYFGSEPAVEYLGIDPLHAEVRQRLFAEDYLGSADSAGFGPDVESAWVDFDGFGLGCLLWGLVEDPDSGKLRTTCRHIPCTQNLYDAHQKKPDRARFAAVWEYYEPDEVRAMGFDAKIVNDAVKTYQYQELYPTEAPTREREFVRLLRYYDTGYGTGRPTEIWWIGSIDSDPVRYETNFIGRGLPLTYGVGFLPPGHSRPMGRVKAQVAAQESLRDVQSEIQDTLEQSAVDLFNARLFDSESDWESLKNGDRRIKVKADGLTKDSPAYQRIPAQEISATLLTFRQMLLEEINTQSGTNQIDRGNNTDGRRSATEMMMLDKRMQANTALTRKQTAKFIVDMVRMYERVSMLGDQHPRTISLRGHSIRLNVDGNPDTWVGMYQKEEAKIVVSTEVMTAEEDMMRKLAETERLIQLAKYLPELDRLWFAKKLVETAGYDPQEALDPRLLAQNGAPGMMPGMPGAGAQMGEGHTNTSESATSAIA